MAWVEAGLREATGLGAKTVYVAAPAGGPGNRGRFRESMIGLADVALRLGRWLCIEPFPGSGLASVGATLEFLEEVGRPQLYLLLDVGHCLIAGEDPAAAVAACGERLGYVHFDDNDGSGDLHLALTDGMLSVGTIRDTLAAVAASPYEGPVAVEGHVNLPESGGGYEEIAAGDPRMPAGVRGLSPPGSGLRRPRQFPCPGRALRER